LPFQHPLLPIETEKKVFDDTGRPAGFREIEKDVEFTPANLSTSIAMRASQAWAVF